MSEVISMLTRPTPETSGRIRYQEAGLFLGFGPKSKKLRRLVRRGEIRAYPDGNVWYFYVDELNAYLERQRQPVLVSKKKVG